MKQDKRLKVRLSDRNLKKVQELMEKKKISLNKVLNELIGKKK